MRPRIVLLTGAPGSGKSTLGRELSSALRIPFIARDDVRGGMAMTAGAWRTTLERLPASDTAVDAFLDIVELTLRQRRELRRASTCSARIAPATSSASGPRETRS